MNIPSGRQAQKLPHVVASQQSGHVGVAHQNRDQSLEAACLAPVTDFRLETDEQKSVSEMCEDFRGGQMGGQLVSEEVVPGR